MNVAEILKKYLKENGFDGWFNPVEGCYCDAEETMNCGLEMSENCYPGYRHGFHIVSEKPEGKDV